MKDKFEAGSERNKKGILDSKEKGIFNLRNGERKSPGGKDGKRIKNKESLPLKASETQDIKVLILIYENGAKNYKKTGQKSDFSPTSKTIVQHTIDRWSGGCVESVCTNRKRETDESTEGPMKFKQADQLGLGHSEDNILDM